MQPVLRSPLTVEERAARHRLIARDSIALSTLLAIVLVLSFVTYLLFHSFENHRLELKQRWKGRGEAALANRQPLSAIDSLRSALAYAPDDRTLQIELATALADAGRTQEALVYFDTLHEAEPGDGMINLQLARLAVTQGNVAQAVSEYEDALDGTWNGDGTLRRRQVRLELSRYLIAQRRFDEARNQLLIAAGNASDNHQLQLTVGALLEQAEGEPDAYNLYRKAMSFSDTRTAGLIGAGRTAAAQSRYLQARNLLDQATLQPDFPRLPADQRAAVHSLLGEAVAILDLYPAQNLPLHVQAVRTVHALQILRAQVEACAAAGARGGISPAPAAAGVPAPATAKQAPEKPPASFAAPASQVPAKDHPAAGPLHSAISAVQRAGSTLAAVAPLVQPEPLAPAQPATFTRVQALTERLNQLPPDDLLEHRMERDPALLESTLQLVYDAENAEAAFASTLENGPGGQGHQELPGCVPPSHDAALLLKIASAPDQIEQQ